MSVAVEEMLHMSLSSNILFSMGVAPQLYGKAPGQYPTPLPYHNPQGPAGSRRVDRGADPAREAQLRAALAFPPDRISRAVGRAAAGPRLADDRPILFLHTLPAPHQIPDRRRFPARRRCAARSSRTIIRPTMWTRSIRAQGSTRGSPRRLRRRRAGRIAVSGAAAVGSLSRRRRQPRRPVPAPLRPARSRTPPMRDRHDLRPGRGLPGARCRARPRRRSVEGRGIALCEVPRRSRRSSPIMPGAARRCRAEPPPPAPIVPSITQADLIAAGLLSDFPDNPLNANYPAGYRAIADFCSACFQYMLIMTETIFRVPPDKQKLFFNEGLHRSMIWVLDKYIRTIRQIPIPSGPYHGKMMAPTFENVDLGPRGRLVRRARQIRQCRDRRRQRHRRGQSQHRPGRLDGQCRLLCRRRAHQDQRRRTRRCTCPTSAPIGATPGNADNERGPQIPRRANDEARPRTPHPGVPVPTPYPYADAPAFPTSIGIGRAGDAAACLHGPQQLQGLGPFRRRRGPPARRRPTHAPARAIARPRPTIPATSRTTCRDQGGCGLYGTGEELNRPGDNDMPLAGIVRHADQRRTLQHQRAQPGARASGCAHARCSRRNGRTCARSCSPSRRRAISRADQPLPGDARPATFALRRDRPDLSLDQRR